jgi:hypothetical protein
VLVIVILDRHAEPDRGVAGVEERDVVAAAAHPVGAPDLPHRQPPAVAFGEPGYEAREIARRAVVLAPVAADVGAQRLGAVGARTFGEHAHMVVLAMAVGPARAADDVVVEDRLDGPALQPRVIR